MKYAVLRIKGQQLKVEEGEEFLVDLFKNKVVNSEVLLYVDGEELALGTPVLKSVKPVLKVIAQEKGNKLHIQKFRAKSRYRRKIGFRPQYIKLRLEKFS